MILTLAVAVAVTVAVAELIQITLTIEVCFSEILPVYVLPTPFYDIVHLRGKRQRIVHYKRYLELVIRKFFTPISREARILTVNLTFGPTVRRTKRGAGVCGGAPLKISNWNPSRNSSCTSFFWTTSEWVTNWISSWNSR